MKSISFSEKELDFIRKQYQVELEEAEEYVENLKNILDKVRGSENMTAPEPNAQEPKKRGRKPKDVSERVSEPIEKIKKKPGRKPKVTIEPPVKEIKKRGRKPAIKKVEPVITEGEKSRKPRSDKGKRRLKPVQKKSIQPPSESETDKNFTASKKKVKRKRTYKRHGVRLAPMSKPITIKEPTETTVTSDLPTQVENTPEKTE